MAPPAGTLRVGQYFLALLAIMAVLYGLVFLPGQRHTPKLGLDLEGGKQVIFEAKAPKGKAPSKSAMSEARQIMEDRVNGSGVTEAEVVIQGNNEIVVSIPGKNTQDISKLGQAASLNFRPLVMPPVNAQASTTPSTSASATTSGSAGATTTPATSSPAAASSPAASPQANDVRPLNAPSSTPPSTPKSTPASTPAASASATPSASASAAPVKKTSDPFKGITFAVPVDEAAYNKLKPEQQQELQARMATYDCRTDQPDGIPERNTYMLACDKKAADASAVYLLGKVIVAGTEISSASAVPPNVGGTGGGTAEWTVSLNLKTTGQGQWAKYTGAHNTGGQDTTTPITSCGSSGTPCADYVAFTLDGAVISAPYNRDAINGQATQISGSFTDSSANQLAKQLKYGALPLSFTPLTNSDVSATLGTAQLKAGMLAGGIGLILVVLYSLIYYRALGFVTIASLLVSGVLTYGCLVVLGREIGFTLTLAGIAGFIVAVGITADSFVVFFERMKDEVHEGRSMRVAVPRAWVRARRTILSADTVSFLAAAVLYYFAAGDVKGFAFTLGLSTILDLVVVFLFTHPIVSLLSRSATFGSARFTGLNAVRAGGIVPDQPAEEPAPSRRRVRVPRRLASAGEASAPVAVLDDEQPPDDLAEPPAAEPPAVKPRAAEPRATEPRATEPRATDARAEEPSAEQPERETSAPQPGTAAERAAARRARMRAQNEKGKR